MQLKQHNILEGKKRKGGGYYLTQHPKKTSIASVVRIIGGPIALLRCVSLIFYEKCDDCNEETCGLHRTMTIVRDATLKVLEKKNLSDLCDFSLA
ncbi:MAG: RrF2 family transcriptional regulator [Ferruginibacter sp.]